MCKVVQNVQSCAKCANMCKNMQKCAKCTKVCKMCIIVQNVNFFAECSPSGLRPFSAVSQNVSLPGDLRNGPKLRFYSYVKPMNHIGKGYKRVLNLGALGPRARQWAKTARFRPLTGKKQINACDSPKMFGHFTVGSFRIDS